MTEPRPASVPVSDGSETARIVGLDDESPARGKMLGRLGWHGQCACCCGQDTKQQEKAREKRRWRR